MKLSSDLKKSLAAYTADLKGDISITLQKGSHKKKRRAGKLFKRRM